MAVFWAIFGQKNLIRPKNRFFQFLLLSWFFCKNWKSVIFFTFPLYNGSLVTVFWQFFISHALFGQNLLKTRFFRLFASAVIIPTASLGDFCFSFTGFLPSKSAFSVQIAWFGIALHCSRAHFGSQTVGAPWLLERHGAPAVCDPTCVRGTPIVC